MSKRNAALEAIGQAPASEPRVVQLTPEPAPVVRQAKADDVARVMLYLHPKVARKFKEIAFVENRKAHDVYLDALDLYLTQQGHGGLKGVAGR